MGQNGAQPLRRTHMHASPVRQELTHALTLVFVCLSICLSVGTLANISGWCVERVVQLELVFGLLC